MPDFVITFFPVSGLAIRNLYRRGNTHTAMDDNKAAFLETWLVEGCQICCGIIGLT